MVNSKITIKEQLNELGIRIIYRKLDCKGRAFIEQKIIVLDPDLSKFEEEQIILHELGHILKLHYSSSLNSPNCYSKKEAEAEHYRIEENIKNYITHTPKEYWNSFDFLNYFGIEHKFENYVSEKLKGIE